MAAAAVINRDATPRRIHAGSTKRSSISQCSPSTMVVTKPTIRPSVSATRVRPSSRAAGAKIRNSGWAASSGRSPSFESDASRKMVLTRW